MANELYHHGVLGMKWGVRRYQNRDGSYKSGAEGRYDPDNGTESSSTSGSSSVRSTSSGSKSHRGLSDGQKKAIKVGVAVAGTALAAYGGYKLYKSGALNPVLEKAGLKGKAFSTEQLKSMGVQAFEPTLTKVATVQPTLVTPTLTKVATVQPTSLNGSLLTNVGAPKITTLKEATKKNPLVFESANLGTAGSTSSKSVNELLGEAAKKSVSDAKKYSSAGDDFTQALLNKNMKNLANFY